MVDMARQCLVNPRSGKVSYVHHPRVKANTEGGPHGTLQSTRTRPSCALGLLDRIRKCLTSQTQTRLKKSIHQQLRASRGSAHHVMNVSSKAWVFILYKVCAIQTFHFTDCEQLSCWITDYLFIHLGVFTHFSKHFTSRNYILVYQLCIPTCSSRPLSHAFPAAAVLPCLV